MFHPISRHLLQLVLKAFVFEPSLERNTTSFPGFSPTCPRQVGEKPGNEVGGNTAAFFAAQCIMSHIPSKAGVNSSR